MSSGPRRYHDAMPFASVNPTTGAVIARYDETPRDEIARALSASRAAFCSWRERSFAERAEPLLAVASRLRQEKDALAELMAIEMGKPVAQGRGEVLKCAWVLEHYASEAERMLASEVVPTDASRSLIAYRPLGTVLAVMPWNFPLWQVFRFAAPTLMAGNTILLKHASNVCGCSLAIERLFDGLPSGVFRSVLVDAKTALDLVDAPEVAAVTLTGSTTAGRAVAARAGAALKKTVMELGGSDPVVVLEDADLDLAAEASAHSRLLNAGQSCIAAKRFIVVEEVREEFERRFLERMRMRSVGDPLDDRTDVGPLARGDLREEVLRQVRETVAAGAHDQFRGRTERNGWLVPCPDGSHRCSSRDGRLRRGGLRPRGGRGRCSGRGRGHPSRQRVAIRSRSVSLHQRCREG